MIHYDVTSLRGSAMKRLQGKKGLIIGIANDKSIAWGCAQACASEGADVAITYLNDKAKPYVEPLAKSINAPILMPYNATFPEQQEALFKTIESTWGSLDFLIHSIAFAPKTDLQNPLVESSREGLLEAIDVSCHSLVRLSNAASKLMKTGGSILTMTYYGAEKVIPHYNLMGPVKALLESIVHYLSSELGAQKIRVNCISPGPIPTRAASGLLEFDTFLKEAEAKSPLKDVATIEDVGALAAFLTSDAARHITGTCIHVDAGLHVMG
jgi:enoyl-[acyl-carrier protein] reductase I